MRFKPGDNVEITNRNALGWGGYGVDFDSEMEVVRYDGDNVVLSAVDVHGDPIEVVAKEGVVAFASEEGGNIRSVSYDEFYKQRTGRDGPKFPVGTSVKFIDPSKHWRGLDDRDVMTILENSIEFTSKKTICDVQARKKREYWEDGKYDKDVVFSVYEDELRKATIQEVYWDDDNRR